MSFSEAVRTCLHKYGTFEGRAKRSEYWFFVLFVLLVVYIPILIGSGFLIAATSGQANGQVSGPLVIPAVIFFILGGLLSLAMVVPNYAVGCRRLHDRGMSGWLQLLALVPCGSIVLLIFWLLPGVPVDNEYGRVVT